MTDNYASKGAMYDTPSLPARPSGARWAAVTIAAGALVALTSLVTSAQAQTTTKHPASHHTTAARRHTRHATTTHHYTAATNTVHAKVIVIHGYSSTHPYSEAAREVSYVNSMVGGTGTASSSEMSSNSHWAPEGHGGGGGIIQLDGSLTSSEPPAFAPHHPPVPDYSQAPSIIQWPAYSGSDDYGYGDFGNYGNYGNVVVAQTPYVAAPIVTSPVITAPGVPVVPTGPAVPVVP